MKIFLLALLLCGAANENFCKNQADLVVEMFKDVQTGAQVKAHPALEPLLNRAKAHKGTPEELWKQIHNECVGVKT